MVKNTKLNLLHKLFCYFTIMIKQAFKKYQLFFYIMNKCCFHTLLLLSLLFIISLQADAQYFYKDLWSNRQVVKEFAILKNDKLKTIKIKSFEDDGEPSDGFFCEKKINKNYTQSQMISKSNVTGQSLLVSDYNNAGLPVKTTDDTPNSTSITQYEYDDHGRLSLVKTVTKGEDDSDSIVETREYFYDQNGVPLKMLRKKNNMLISTILFSSDANGNVTEENVEGSGAIDKKYYYYYDDKNRLTDVVHFNERAGRLLPNYMYEYNSLDQLSQMISTEEGNSNYLIWQYTYNDKGLRETEKCFSREKRLLGTIDYSYQ
jgi:YD repeat-containing protein